MGTSDHHHYHLALNSRAGSIDHCLFHYVTGHYKKTGCANWVRNITTGMGKDWRWRSSGLSICQPQNPRHSNPWSVDGNFLSLALHHTRSKETICGTKPPKISGSSLPNLPPPVSRVQEAVEHLLSTAFMLLICDMENRNVLWLYKSTFSVIMIRQKATTRSPPLTVWCHIYQYLQPTESGMFWCKTTETWGTSLTSVRCTLSHSLLLHYLLTFSRHLPLRARIGK